MAHSVTITSRIPSFEETAKFYGLSKADTNFVSGLFVSTTNLKRSGTSETRKGMFAAKRNTSRKTKSRDGKAA
jgi:hypothetical protein